MKVGRIIAMSMTITGLAGAGPNELTPVRQLTHAPQGHVLTNINAWSPDGAWLVYDTRTNDEFNGNTIERVNVADGEVQRLYTSAYGAHCGVVTHSPTDGRIVFIHGPENPTTDWTYSFSRRRGAVVDTPHPGVSHPLDAMTYAPPFKPGALRGGSHVHVFSPDGQWVSFTYEDNVLAQLDANPEASTHEPNQRNIGVSVPIGPVLVGDAHPRNNDGDWFSVVVTRTVAQPSPGSDEISKAFEEGWVGQNGYLRADGSRQCRALTFQGHVIAMDGRQHAEVFIVDLPDDLTIASDAPLEGTATTKPSPPQGVHQRRLTFTGSSAYPGVVDAPRHWLRISPDGSAIAFLMRDDAGVVQIWTVSPNGGDPRQVTRNPRDISSAFTWSSSGDRIAHVMDGSVCVTDMKTGTTRRLTPSVDGDAGPTAQSCVFSPSDDAIAYTRMVEGFQQIFVVTLP